MKIKSLAKRLMVLMGVTIVVIFLSFGFYIENSSEEHFAQLDLQELDSAAITIRDNINSVNLTDVVSSALLIHQNVFVYVKDKNNSTFFISDNFPPSLIDKVKNSNRSQILQDKKDDYRIQIYDFENKKLIAGLNINFHQHYIHQFRITLWLSALVASIIMVLMSFFVIYFSFKPVKTIIKKVEEITFEKLNTRLDTRSAPSELQSLIGAFNDMMSHIEDVFKRQSDFSADIAHELRTPISSLTTQTQIALSRSRNAKEYEEILYSNLEEFERMSKMVNDMLFLSACEKNSSLKPQEVDIGIECAKLIEYFTILAEEKKLTILQKGDGFKIKCDKDMIRRAVSNLISNAINYSQQNSRITIELLGNSNILRISNKTQFPLSKENIQRLFDRFYKVEDDRNKKSGGSGIGLSIVKTIIESHKGSISVEYDDEMVVFIVAF